MRAIVLEGARAVEVKEIAEPVAAAGEMLVEVAAAGVCGIDVKGFTGDGSWARPGLVPGHEVVGRTGAGRRVVVDPLMSCGSCAECVRGAENLCLHVRVPGMGDVPGWMAERIAAPHGQVIAIPDELADERALLAEPLANVVHLFRGCDIRAGIRLGVVGVGLMGTLALQVARRIGADDVLAVDACADRVAMARTMRVKHAVKDPAEARHCAGYGLDVVIDAAGTIDARELALELCRPGGTVVLVGMAAKRSELNFGAAIRREICIRTSFGYTRRDFLEAVQLLAAGAVDLTPCTRVVLFDEAQRAFELAQAKQGVLKVVLQL